MKKAISGKFQKILAAIVAATMLLATMVSAIPVLADTANSYNGQMLGYYTHKYPATLKVDSITHNVSDFANGVTTSVFSYKALEADITPENPANKVNTGIVFYDETNEDSFASAVELSETSAFMFYIKLPTSMPETKVVLSGQSYAEYGGTAMYPLVREYGNDSYILSANSPVWETVETVRFAFEESGVPNAAAVTLPSGFEGWVRVPFTNFNLTDWTYSKLNRMNFYLDNYSATEPFSYGAFMVVDNPTENLSSLTLGDKTINLTEKAAYNTEALALGEFTGNEEYTLSANGTSISQTVGLFGNGNTLELNVTTEADIEKTYYSDAYYNADFVPYLYAGAGTVVPKNTWGTMPWPYLTFESNFASGCGRTIELLESPTDANVVNGVFTQPEETFRSESYYVNFTFNKDSVNSDSDKYPLSWKSGNSFIFYVENTGTLPNKIGISITDSPWVHLNAGKEYYLLSVTSAEWKSETAVKLYESSERGYMELPAGFKGWVRIPCDNLLNVNNLIITDKEAKVARIFVANLGGDYGKINIGQFGVVDSTENLTYISSSYSNNKPVSMITAPYTATKAEIKKVSNTSSGSVTGNNVDGAITVSVNTAIETDGVYEATSNDDIEIEFNSAPNLPTTGSLMFYLKHTDATADAKIMVMHNWYATFDKRDYYLLQDGTDNWQQKTTVTATPVSEVQGYLEIPADFEGWVRIPASSLVLGRTNEYSAASATALYTRIVPGLIGGEYGSLTISDISVVEETDDRYYFNLGDKYVDISHQEVSADLFKEIRTYNVAVKDGKVTASPYTLKAEVTPVVLADDQGIMFYAKTEDAANIEIALSNTNTTVDGFNYSYIQHNSLWTSVTSTNGTIALPANFEGWVRLSADAFVGTDMEFVAIGFKDTATCTLSDFMITDKSTYDLDYIILDGQKTALFVELYDSNADGEIDIRDLVRMKRFVAMVEGVNVPQLAADIDGSKKVDATDTTLLRKRLINGPEEEVSEVALSRYLSEEGYTTSANYSSASATVDNVNFNTLPAEYTTLLNNNPDRGWSSNEVYNIPSAGSENIQDSYESILSDVRGKLNVNTYDQTVMLSRIFFYMGNYRTVESIPDEAIAYMKNVLKAYGELDVKVYLNIYYQKYNETPVNADIVLSHIDQYADLWNSYSDVIYCYNMSLLGRYGEWTDLNNGVGEYIAVTDEDKTQIVTKVLDNLPEDMYVTMRSPELKVYAEGHSRYSDIGYDQSAFFGYDYTDKDIGQGNYRPGYITEDDNNYYELAMKDAPYSIMFGEAFTTNWFNNNPDYAAIDALGAIKGMSEQRFGAFNINHAYGDYKIYDRKITDTVMYQWKLNKIAVTDLSDLGVLVTDSWFKDVRGKTVERSAFDYIREYLGYRISADKLSISGGNNVGEAINISMDLKNYGFSAAFNLESGFAILDESNNIVSEAVVGNPAEWHSTSPEDYSNRTQLTHNITANMNLPDEAGNYKIAFFLRNSLGQTARLDNLIEYADGYNILHMFSIA